MRYLEAGLGRPAILLHSFPLSADQWRRQLDDVPSGWRFIAPDLPGLGPAPDDGEAALTIDQHAIHVLALMDHLGIAGAAIVGVSMGGYVALALLRQAADRVTSVVLADTRATADTEEGRAGRDRMMALIERDGLEALGREMLPKLLGATTHRDRPEVVAEVRRLILANRADGVRAAVQAMRDRPDSTPLLGTIRCPALILCGEEDTLTPPAASEAMHQAIPGSRLVILPGAGHLSNLEAPDEFSGVLAEALQ
jgi:pimeloyl-ACP methyl ester carboxylesterase